MASLRPVSVRTAPPRTSGNTTARSVRLYVTPEPRSVHARRAILRIVKEFGEIALFRPLKNDPDIPASNVILAVYQREESARKLIEDSPLQFVVEPPRRPLQNTSLSTMEILQPERRNGIRSDNEEPRGGREYYLTADRSLTDHIARIRRYKYFWGFDRTEKTFPQEDLAKNVPIEGLSANSPRPTPVPRRVQGKRLAHIAQRKTLRQVWEEGQAAGAYRPTQDGEKISDASYSVKSAA